MKASELRSKDQAELKTELNDLLKAQFGLRMQLATQQLTNTSQLKKVRRDIARVKTALKRTLIGKVVSDKMDKTVSVLIERRVKHPLYGKIVRRSKKYLAHDEANQAKIGDTVEIQEGRPISKNKSWVLTKVIQVAQIV